MLPGFELANCTDLAVPPDVMHHVVRVESSFNPFAIGVVGARLARQPRTLPEALATARMLEGAGYDFSLGLAQVNRRNLANYGLSTYVQAFDACANVRAGSRILAECNTRAGGDWGKAFSCYYSGNFQAGYRDGYVQKIYASMRGDGMLPAIPFVHLGRRRAVTPRTVDGSTRAGSAAAVAARISAPAAGRASPEGGPASAPAAATPHGSAVPTAQASAGRAPAALDGAFVF